MKKKLLLALGTTLVIGSLSGCGNDDTQVASQSSSEVTAETEATDTKVTEEVTESSSDTTAENEATEEAIEEPAYDEEMGDYPSNAMEERTGKTQFSSYDEVISLLEGDEAYALVKIKGYDGDVLLVTDGVYDNLDGNMATIQAVPYTMKSTGFVTADSSFTSGGTAYPISIGEDGLVYLYGNHSIETECYGSNGTDDVGIMVMNTLSITEFDANGEASKVCGFHRDPEITNILENESVDYDENDVDAFYAELEKFENTTPVNFTTLKK